MTVRPSGISALPRGSPGCGDATRCLAVTAWAKRSRSTAKAPPAGTGLRSALAMMSEPSRRISSFSKPAGLASRFAPSELVQTSSARFSV